MQQNKSQKEQFRELLDQVLSNTPYSYDRNLHQIYNIGLLTELLVYSGYNLIELREHLKYLRDVKHKKQTKKLP